jgi:hypothetical protein
MWQDEQVERARLFSKSGAVELLRVDTEGFRQAYRR